ncbi:oxygenase MpaB family protein [Persicobacter sp. CCB-QB2]|uniref:oxygenase MpaB family protein n=1 Tax=Persicobacter sp. CCB-QB2 TaxID=1561025 RepID=UPI0006A95701|nr:oxygenase MpaB family protein [Persicobacter sp. CCB-QB2]
MPELTQNPKPKNIDWKALRLLADPLADEAIAPIVEGGYAQIAKVNALFDQLKSNKHFPEDQIPDYLKTYFAHTSSLPDFADPQLIAKGERFFQQHGTLISMLLLLKSLPATYACGLGAEVLHRTGQFEMQQKNLQPFVRRLMETSQFVLDIMADGGLGKKGKGIRSIQKVRLMHAVVRARILKDPAGWEVDHFGMPINQEDMLGTLLSFSVFPLMGLEQLGIALKDEEVEAYLHVWKVVGHLMGVQPELIPHTYQEGKRTGMSILQDQRLASKAGEVLTKSLIEFFEYVIPGNILDDVPAILIEFFIGKELSKAINLQVEPHHLEKKVSLLFRHFVGAYDELLDRPAKMRRLVEIFNNSFLQAAMHYYNGSSEIAFYLSPSLKHRYVAPHPGGWYERRSLRFWDKWKLTLSGRKPKWQLD